MAERDSYHHGDLRAALIAAGEIELAEAGLEGFSLRRVAKRVGVSHSAPAHHFGDTPGLLNALATEGFRRFLAAMEARQAAAPPDPRSQFVASGLGYLDFAESAPALFRLMFASGRTDTKTPELAEAGRAAYDNLVDCVARLRGVSPYADAAAMLQVAAAWSLVHGYAELVISGRMRSEAKLTKPERDARLARILADYIAVA
jgi:AcrR family transcriptional regulator